jgi:hypothetical protein
MSTETWVRGSGEKMGESGRESDIGVIGTDTQTHARQTERE